MAITQEKVTICTCERCGHDWQPKEEKKPQMCPKCKSLYWNQKPEAKQ